MIWLLLFNFVAFAEKSAFEQALEHQQNVETHERWVTIDGIEYREVEYKGDRYYIKFKDRGTAQINCGLVSPNTPHKIDAGIAVTKRMYAFVQLLRDVCVSKGGHERVDVALDPRIGFTLPEDSKSAIKNKKVYMAPTGLGFGGEF